MRDTIKNGVSWVVYSVIIMVDIVLNYQLFHWLSKPFTELMKHFSALRSWA